MIQVKNLLVHLHVYSTKSMIWESRMDKTDFVIEMTRERVT